MNILLVGLGRQGTRLLERLSDRGHHVEVVAVNRYARWDIYMSYLSDPTWDAVFICSNDDTHEKYARAALCNKKHVYIEKPVGSNLDQTCRILSDRDEAGVVFSAGYIFLWHPCYEKLLDPNLNTWHFCWTKLTKAESLDRTLMSHHLSMAIMAWGRPTNSDIINLDDKSIGQFTFKNGNTMTSTIKRGVHTTHEVEARGDQYIYRADLQKFGDPDPISKMLDHFEGMISKLSEHKPREWSMDLEHLVYEVARVLDE